MRRQPIVESKNNRLLGVSRWVAGRHTAGSKRGRKATTDVGVKHGKLWGVRGAPVPMATSQSGASPIVPVSVAVAQDGQLYLLANDGEAWRAHPDDIQEYGARAWRRLDVPEDLLFLELSVDPAGTIVAHARIATGSRAWRPSGDSSQIDAYDGGEQRFVLASDGSWHPYDPDRLNALESSYGRFSEASNRLSNVTLGMPLLPGYEPLHIASDGYIKNKLAPFRGRPRIGVFGRPPREAAGRMERWLNYYRAHYGFQTERGAMNASVRTFLLTGDSLLAHPDAVIVPSSSERTFPALDLPATFEVSSAGMHQRPVPSARDILRDEIGAGIAANAHLALDRIEHALGLRDDLGNDVDEASYRASPHYQRFTVASADAGIIASVAATIMQRREADLHTDDNVLHRLLLQAERLFAYSIDGAPEKQLVIRLRDLIDGKQLKFSANEWPGREDDLHAFASIQLSKIAHDLGIGMAAAVHVSDRLQSDKGARHARRTEDVARGIALDYAKQLDSERSPVNGQFARFSDLRAFSASLQNVDSDAVDKQLAQDALELASMTPTRGAVKRLHPEYLCAHYL